MQDQSFIDIYVSVGTDQVNTHVENLLSSTDLNAVVQQTLQAADIHIPVVFTLLITDDDGVRDMNRQYREQDKTTDVLSFPLLDEPLATAPAEQLWASAPVEEEQEHPDFVTPPGLITNLGDIIMSWPVIERQASEAGHSSLTELLYLLSHGILHLVGYDDQTEAGYQAMVGMQLAVLQSLGYKANVK